MLRLFSLLQQAIVAAPPQAGSTIARRAVEETDARIDVGRDHASWRHLPNSSRCSTLARYLMESAPMSPMRSYLAELRGLIGNRLLLLPSVAAVIHDHAGNLLLQEKSSGEGWSLPAGAIEPGETPQEAVIREVVEETGLTVVPATILGVFGGREFRYTYPNGDHVEYIVTLFGCRIVDDCVEWTDRETRSLRYFGPDEMPPLALPYPVSTFFSQGSNRLVRSPGR